jgi:iron complex transport system ATP-binding protein
MSNTPVLSCSDLSVGYKGEPVLSDISLSFEAGRFISLLGPNGAGKTTLLRTLSRHLEPLGGRIEVMGRPLARITAMELAQSMAVVLTDRVSPPLFTASEFVALGRYPHTGFLGRLRPADIEAVESALVAVHAEKLAHRPFSDLSDGERQKILVARALAQQPQLLLLDEPTNHLDLKHRIEVMGILRDLCRTRGITVGASLHDVDVAAKVSDRVALIKSGSMSAWGPPEAVLTGAAVSDLYDFSEAAFNRRLGGIELRGDGRRGRAFVVAGMGTGAMVYRILAKGGFAIATGVLQTHDLDYHVASALGARCTALPPDSPVNEKALADAAREIDRCDVVIDCGFDLSTVNRRNMDLIDMALGIGKPVLSLRTGNGSRPVEGATPSAIVACGDAARLLEVLDRRFP